MTNPIIIGCNYHTVWQSNKSMRFVLIEIYNDKAKLMTRTSRKNFWTNVSDLIYIHTNHNNKKARELGYKEEI